MRSLSVSSATVLHPPPWRLVGHLGHFSATHLLAGNSSRTFLTAASSTAGTSAAYQSGSYEPVRRVIVPGLTPNFAVPVPSDDPALREDEDPLEPGDLDLGLAPRVENPEE